MYNSFFSLSIKLLRKQSRVSFATIYFSIPVLFSTTAATSSVTTSLLSIWLISFSSFLTIYYIDKNKIINRYTRHFVSIIHISYPPQPHIPPQYEHQIAPTPPDQTNPVYPAKTYLLYVLQSLLPTQPENYILPLI